jgi:PQQ-dependent catabolism-associated CXXCW motif protein
MKRSQPLVAGVVVTCVSVFSLSCNVRAADPAQLREPESYRTDNYNAPVPSTLKGVRAVVTADGAKALQARSALLIDVHPLAPKPANLPASTIWRDPPHRSIAGAVWLPNVGYGNLSTPMLNYFQRNLTELTAGDHGKPMVFFCLRDCWMSWNASKRAIELGFSQVYWFSEGSDAWEENGYPIAIVAPAP